MWACRSREVGCEVLAGGDRTFRDLATSVTWFTECSSGDGIGASPSLRHGTPRLFPLRASLHRRAPRTVGHLPSWVLSTVEGGRPPVVSRERSGCGSPGAPPHPHHADLTSVVRDGMMPCCIGQGEPGPTQTGLTVPTCAFMDPLPKRCVAGLHTGIETVSACVRCPFVKGHVSHLSIGSQAASLIIKSPNLDGGSCLFVGDTSALSVLRQKRSR